MLNLAVCDDDAVFLDQMRRLLDRDSRVGSAVALYSAPEDFLRAVDAGAGDSLDAVLMDISFEAGPSGLQCASALYRTAPQVAVIYVTGYTDYAQYILLEDANVAGYLTKPVDGALLGRYLDKLSARQARQSLTVSVRGRTRSLPAMSIRYIESRNHAAHIHTVSGKDLTAYEKLSVLQRQLPEQFVQCHKSFLVNMEQVERMERDALVLRGGGTIPVSRSRAKAAREAFFRCIGGKVL